MGRNWLVISKIGIGLFGAYLVWHLFRVIAMGDPPFWADTLKLIAALITLVFARSQAKRKYDEKQENKRALREWAAEEESRSGKTET